MTDEVQQATTAEQAAIGVQQYQQIQANKISSALNAGMALFEEDINVPIKLNDGLADLKWLLRNLLGGQFNINLDPSGQLAQKNAELVGSGQEVKKPVPSIRGSRKKAHQRAGKNGLKK